MALHRCQSAGLNGRKPEFRMGLPRPLLNEEAYRALLESSDCDSVQVIKFTSESCKACKAMAPKFERMVEDWPEVSFYEMLFDTNKELAKAIGIKLLPYMVLNTARGGVDGFVCGSSKLRLLEEKLEQHVPASRGVRRRWRRRRWRRAAWWWGLFGA